MSNTCAPFSLFSYEALGVCGGHGECDSISEECVCNNGYSSSTDLIDSSSFDCATNFLGIRILFGISLSVCLYAYFISFGIIRARTTNFFESRKQNKAKSLCSNKGLIAVYIMFLCMIPLFSIFCVLKIIDPTRSIGFDTTLTFIFFVMRIAFYISVSLYQTALITALLSGIKKLTTTTDRYVKFTLTLQVSASLNGCIPLAILFRYQNDLATQIILAKTMYVWLGITLLLQAIGAKIMSIVVVRVLGESASLKQQDSDSRGKTKILMENILKVQRAVVIQGTVVGLINMVFYSVPFLLNKHAYFMGIYWCAPILLGVKTAFAVNLDSYQSKSMIGYLQKRILKVTIKSPKESTQKGNNLSDEDMDDFSGESFEFSATGEKIPKKSQIVIGGIVPSGVDNHTRFISHMEVRDNSIGSFHQSKEAY